MASQACLQRHRALFRGVVFRHVGERSTAQRQHARDPGAARGASRRRLCRAKPPGRSKSAFRARPPDPSRLKTLGRLSLSGARASARLIETLTQYQRVLDAPQSACESSGAMASTRAGPRGVGVGRSCHERQRLVGRWADNDA
eukprot:227833-Chlamydomonas_euryale.AAC.3